MPFEPGEGEGGERTPEEIAREAGDSRPVEERAQERAEFQQSLRDAGRDGRYQDIIQKIKSYLNPSDIKSRAKSLTDVLKSILKSDIELKSETIETISNSLYNSSKPDPASFKPNNLESLRGTESFEGRMLPESFEGIEVNSDITQVESPAGVTPDQVKQYTKQMQEISNSFTEVLRGLGGREKSIVDLFRSEIDKINKKQDATIKELNDTIETLQRDNKAALEQIAKDLDTKRTAKEAGKKHSRTNYKSLISLILVLGSIASSLVGWLVFCQYCQNNSGCIKISLAKGSDKEIHEKVFCSGNQNDLKTFGVLQCGCYPKLKTPYDGCNCGDNTNRPTPTDISRLTCYPIQKDNFGNNLNDDDDKCQANKQSVILSGDLSNGYMYYSYQIMDPIDGAFDLLKRVGDLFDPSGLFGKIMHYVILIVAIFGILLVLYIIYKFVSNRGSSETVKIVSAPPAPSVPSSTSTPYNFGKYLGDLSKFSNYGLIGHCGVYDLIPK